jgi:hypothetical protein
MQIPSIFTTPAAWRPWLINGLLLALLICLLFGCVPPPPRAGHAPAPPHPSALNHQPAKTGDGALSGASTPTNIFGNLQV